jgi:hypothetical protein
MMADVKDVVYVISVNGNEIKVDELQVEEETDTMIRGKSANDSVLLVHKKKYENYKFAFGKRLFFNNLQNELMDDLIPLVDKLITERK